jgi:hypothetical protein
MDLQSSLLVSLQHQGKPMDWLWFDAASDPASWRAFRRAVFSSQSVYSKDVDAQDSPPHEEAA